MLFFTNLCALCVFVVEFPGKKMCPWFLPIQWIVFLLENMQISLGCVDILMAEQVLHFMKLVASGF